MISLRQIVERDGPLGYRRAARFVRDVAGELSKLHDRGLLHRDLRPANVVFDEVGRVRLPPNPMLRHDDAGQLDPMINEGAYVEIADYMAPELALNNGVVDAGADIYSLGCMFYFSLTGHAPFCEGSISERLLKHQIAKVPAIGREREDVPAALAELCERMMSKKRDDRPQTAMEVASALREWLAEENDE